MTSRHRIRFFPTCLGTHFFGSASTDAIHLLRSLSVEVDVVEDATCCGQPAWNAGATGEAAAVARWLSPRLSDSSDSPLVLPSGSCAAMIRHAYPRLGIASSVPVYELSEYLVDVLGVTTLGSGLEGVRVAYHHGCHALRELGVRSQPIRLLTGSGARLVDWTADEECCGFGGLFAAKLPHVSAAMADRKLDTLPDGSGIDVLTSADGGCLLQLRGRLEQRGGGGVEVMHLASLLLLARGEGTPWSSGGPS